MSVRYQNICGIYSRPELVKNIPKGAVKIFNILNEEGYEAFLVGGCVRDLIMGVEPHDYDIATDATPDIVMYIFGRRGYNVIPTGIEFGTVTVVMDDGNYEITTYRLEFYTRDRGRKPVVSWADNLYDDVIRRDFTINALAMDIKGNIIDCVGGIRDINNKIIRFVGNPETRISEDPLRMLRALRFAGKFGFKIEHRSYEAIKQNYWKLEYISWERIRDEIIKSANTSGFHIFISLMFDSNLYLIVMPELGNMHKIRHGYEYHHHGETVLEHTIEGLMRLDNIYADYIVKIAYLLHDVGKPAVYMSTGKFYRHELVGSEIAENILRRWKMSYNEIRDITYLVRWHMYPLQYEDKDPEYIAKKMVAKHKQYSVLLLIMAYADTGNIKFLEASNIAKELLSKKEIKPIVTGYDIMRDLGIPPGPMVGELKQKLYEIQITYNLKTKEDIYRKARELGII